MKRLRDIKNLKRKRMKKTKIKTSFVKNLMNEKINLLNILATCIITDGSIYKKRQHARISFYSKDEKLKDILFDILSLLSDYNPSILKSKDGVFYVRVSDYNLYKKLIKLSPDYKTGPNNYERKNKINPSINPSLRFLFKSRKKDLRYCIRFALSTDGSITYNKETCYKELQLRCSNYNLCKDWKDILNKFDINAHISKDKNSWSGFGGLRIYNRESFKNFLKLGGFIPKVKITEKSKYYKGIDKNKVLRMSL